MPIRSPQRVLLLHPGVQEHGRIRDFPPWGILAVAGALGRAGHAVRVVDLNGEPEVERALSAHLEAWDPTVVGVTGKWGHAARRALRVLRAVASTAPSVHRVLGGPLVPVLDPDTELARAAHAQLAGDGETAILRWLQEGMPQTRRTEPAQDADLSRQLLEVSPLFDLSPYVLPPSRSDLGCRTLYVSAARGCDGRCAFCYQRLHAPAGLRTPPVDPLVAELAAVARHHDLSGIYFVDDSLVSRAPWRRSLCHALAAALPDLRWGVDLRTALMTSETLDTLWSGGCRALYTGLETLDPHVRQQVLSKGDPDPLAAVDRALDRGFTVRASVVLGWPEETAASIRRTLDAIHARPRLLFDPFLFNPLPRTPLFTRYAPHLGPQHLYTEYAPGAPNLSHTSDEVLLNAWNRLWEWKVGREESGRGR